MRGCIRAVRDWVHCSVRAHNLRSHCSLVVCFFHARATGCAGVGALKVTSQARSKSIGASAPACSLPPKASKTAWSGTHSGISISVCVRAHAHACSRAGAHCRDSGESNVFLTSFVCPTSTQSQPSAQTQKAAHRAAHWRHAHWRMLRVGADCVPRKRNDRGFRWTFRLWALRRGL